MSEGWRGMSELDLDAIAEKWLKPCGSCDAGLPMTCTCPPDDFRPDMQRLIGRAATLRARVMELENEVARLAGLLQTQSEEFHADLRVQGHQWAALVAERNKQLNRQTGIVARQRLTIQEQGETIKELRDQVADLEAYVEEFKREGRCEFW